MDKRILSDEQKEMLRQTAKGRSRNSRGQFVDTVTAQEARTVEQEQEQEQTRVQELEARIAELEADSKADDESIAWFYKENERLNNRIISDRCAFMAFLLFVAYFAFFVGRWAR